MNDIYRELQVHLDKYPVGYPATESGVEIELLKYFFTPLEATAAICLCLTGASVKRIKKRLYKGYGIDLSEDELTGILDKLFMDGSIRRSSDKPYRYSNAMLAIGIFEYHVDDLTPELMEILHKYYSEAFKDEFFRASLPQLRTSPHLKAIVPEHKIDTYDNIKKIVSETKESIHVANCVCKQGEELLGKKCSITDNYEICILFGDTGYLDRGRARTITKEECLSILDEAEEKGLVIQPGNSLQPFCICLCCGCCCGVLTMAKEFDNPASLFSTNYYAEIDCDKCNGCGICIKRCQMDAITSPGKGEKVLLDLSRCIGCGLCVTKCRKGAISLRKKSKLTRPPMNIELLYLKILMRKAGKMKMTINMLRLILGMRL